MQNSNTLPKPGESTWLWLIKIITGVLIIGILVLHFIVNHYLGPEGLLTFDEILQYYRNYPIVPIMEGFFLVFVVSHSLIGVRSIILDLNPSRQFLRVLDVILVVIGVVSIVYGIWLLGAILAQAPPA
jgi:succinate dehydrogenase / fumarate reductase membrane anchor subunit